MVVVPRLALGQHSSGRPQSSRSPSRKSAPRKRPHSAAVTSTFNATLSSVLTNALVSGTPVTGSGGSVLTQSARGLGSSAKCVHFRSQLFLLTEANPVRASSPSSPARTSRPFAVNAPTSAARLHKGSTTPITSFVHYHTVIPYPVAE